MLRVEEITPVPFWLVVDTVQSRMDCEDRSNESECEPDEPMNIKLFTDYVIKNGKRRLKENGGHRNETTRDLGYLAGDYNLEENTARDIMLKHFWPIVGATDFDEAEFKRTIHNAYEYRRKSFGNASPLAKISDIPDEEIVEYYPAEKEIKILTFSATELNKIPIKPKTFYLSPWLFSGGIVLIVADPGTGKTLFCLSVAIAIASGKGFGPWAAGESVAVLYVDAEMSANDMVSRVHRLSGGDPPANLHLVIDSVSRDTGHSPSRLSNPRWREAMIKYCLDQGVKVLFLDNLSSMTPSGDENTKEDWADINQWLLDLRAKGLAVVLVHHTGKSGSQRGTSSREDNIDISIKLIKDHGAGHGSNARFKVEFTKTREIDSDSSHLVKPIVMECKFNNWIVEDIKLNRKVEILSFIQHMTSNKRDVTRAMMKSESEIPKGTIDPGVRAAVKSGLLSEQKKKGGALLTLTAKGVDYLSKNAENALNSKDEADSKSIN